MENQDYVVLVDRQNKVLGTAPKLKTHNSKTPLHRGFSVFLFNKKGELLLQKRSRKKKTWPRVWSNSCCGHPALGEKITDAVRRRLKFELGIDKSQIYNMIPDFSYRAKRDGIVENELCPVLVTFTNNKPSINNEEVENIRWIKWEEFLKETNDNPGKYSVWCELEAKLLSKNKEFLELYRKFVK